MRQTTHGVRYASVIVVAGVVLLIFGTIFRFQGSGNIGPESSFMYQNRDWIDYGLVIMASGIASIGIGAALLRRKA